MGEIRPRPQRVRFKPRQDCDRAAVRELLLAELLERRVLFANAADHEGRKDLQEHFVGKDHHPCE